VAQRTQYRYNPIDLDKNRAVGILLPLGGSPMFKSSYTTEQQAISNLKGLLLTTKGERPFQPLFGANIYSLLFENIGDDLGSILETSLTEDIGFWLPYILLDGVEVNTEPDYNRVSIKISFRVTEQGANQTIILEVDNQGGLSIV
jgi:phage baseplate assembly protein W